MSATPTLLFRGAASLTTTTTLYTTPSATSTIVNSVMVSNTDSVARTFTMSFGGVKWAETVSIAANSVIVFDFKQVLNTTNTIQGGASATTVTFSISGVEVA
jgi:hypothetical protein